MKDSWRLLFIYLVTYEIIISTVMIHDQWQPRKFPTLQDILRTVALEERGKGTRSMCSLMILREMKSLAAHATLTKS